MKKITLAFLLFVAFAAKAQEVKNDTIKTISIDSLKQTIDEHSMKFSALDERLATSDATLEKLAKIKISGYIQAQYDVYDIWGPDGHGQKVASTTPATLINRSFYLRRARIKFTYEALEGVKFVLQPDFSFDKVSLKDAYVVLNDRWTKTYAAYLGQFDRPNYEVEYSSGSMESLERSKMAGILYPGEKELGTKFEANFDTTYNIPLKLQVAIMNGNFNLGTTSNQTKDIDNKKDIMLRAVYSVKLPSKGLGIDFGAHSSFSKTVILPGTTLTGFTDVNNKPFTPKIGDELAKSWYGGEMQIYYDFLGGMALKGEYIKGTISGTTNPIQVNSAYAYNRVRDFDGFYTTLIKNVGVKNQFIARFDVWDPNTKASGSQVTNAGDLKYSTWSVSWQYFFDDNIKINLGCSLPTNEKSSTPGVGVDYLNRDKKDNIYTLRIQAKF
jgi:hypothetical protein